MLGSSDAGRKVREGAVITLEPLVCKRFRHPPGETLFFSEVKREPFTMDLCILAFLSHRQDEWLKPEEVSLQWIDRFSTGFSVNGRGRGGWGTWDKHLLSARIPRKSKYVSHAFAMPMPAPVFVGCFSCLEREVDLSGRLYARTHTSDRWHAGPAVQKSKQLPQPQEAHWCPWNWMWNTWCL